MQQFINVVSSSAGYIAFFIAHAVGLILIPLGLPGLWLQVLACAGLAIATDGTQLSWLWLAAFVVLALIAEVLEFFSGQMGAKKFGGSKKAAWGALLGGICGALFGGFLVPIPIIGPVVMSFAGTFAGALIGEMKHQGLLEPNLRVGFGAVLGKTIGVAVKLCTGLLILIMSIIVIIR